MEQLPVWANESYKAIMDWAHPELKLPSPTGNFPLARFDQMVVIAAAYAAFVLFGSLIMKQTTKTFEPKPLKILYNVFQVVLCTYMTLETCRQYVLNDYQLVCNEFNYKGTGMADILWVFYLSKILDFVDTVFIILGQKWAQLSFLHVYHHLSTYVFYWLNLNAGYDGDIYLTIILNSFVHLVMYSYYLLATLGKKNIWWKPYVTVLQMVQFIIMNAQAIYVLYNKCPYPNAITFAYLIYIQSLFWLFFQFFVSSYGKKKSGSKDKGEKSKAKKTD